MIDIYSLDLNDLIKLEGAIKDRKKELKEKSLTKEDLRAYPPLANYILENFPGTVDDMIWSEKHQVKVSELGGDVHSKITKGMTLLCDMALNNYQPSQWRSGADQSQIARQSTAIPSTIAKDYQAMWADIWNVYMKYAKMKGEKAND